MEGYELGAVQARFADIIWENAPISSPELVHICEQRLNWKKSTTYTVLKKLCDKGLFRNEGGVVCALVSKEEYNSLRSASFVEETFSGSLPAFIAAFISNKAISPEEADEIRRMIDSFKGGAKDE